MAMEVAAEKEPIWKPLGATDATFLEKSLLASKLIFQKATDRMSRKFVPLVLG
jgi:hypothetical protein